MRRGAFHHQHLCPPGKTGGRRPSAAAPQPDSTSPSRAPALTCLEGGAFSPVRVALADFTCSPAALRWSVNCGSAGSDDTLRSRLVVVGRERSDWRSPARGPAAEQDPGLGLVLLGQPNQTRQSAFNFRTPPKPVRQDHGLVGCELHRLNLQRRGLLCAPLSHGLHHG